MKTKTTSLIIALFAAAFLLGCGGSQKQTMKDRELEGMSDDIDPVEALVGDVAPVPIEEDTEEQPAPVAETPAEKPDGDVIAGNQGAFLPTLYVLNEVVKGKYTVATATDDPQIVKENVPTGQELLLAPGTYDFTFTSEAVAGELPLTLRGVEIPTGRRIKRDVKYKVGKITLVTGAKCAKSPIKIKPKGASDWLPGKYFTCKEIILPAGNYEAVRGTVPISGIQVYDGGIRDILIRKQ